MSVSHYYAILFVRALQLTEIITQLKYWWISNCVWMMKQHRYMRHRACLLCGHFLHGKCAVLLYIRPYPSPASSMLPPLTKATIHLVLVYVSFLKHMVWMYEYCIEWKVEEGQLFPIEIGAYLQCTHFGNMMFKTITDTKWGLG